MNVIKLDIPLSNEILTTVRLTTGGICSLAGLSFDDSEDCKVCVTESLLLLSHRGYRRARITYFREDGLTVAIEGDDRSGQEVKANEDEISAALVQALAQNVVMDKAGERIGKIGFKFGLKA